MKKTNFIQFFRKRAGYTQARLAEAIAVSVKTLFRYEASKREPRASDIQKLCEVLGVTEAELLNGPASNEVRFSIVWEVEKEMNAMEVKMGEFKIGRGEDDDFGIFRFSKDIDIEEIGRQFMNHLRAAREGRETYDKTLKKLEG